MVFGVIIVVSSVHMLIISVAILVISLTATCNASLLLSRTSKLSQLHSHCCSRAAVKCSSGRRNGSVPHWHGFSRMLIGCPRSLFPLLSPYFLAVMEVSVKTRLRVWWSEFPLGCRGTSPSLETHVCATRCVSRFKCDVGSVLTTLLVQIRCCVRCLFLFVAYAFGANNTMFWYALNPRDWGGAPKGPETG